MNERPINLSRWAKVPYAGEAETPAELVLRLQAAAKVCTCPDCGKRQRWLGQVHSRCHACLAALFLAKSK